MIDTAVVVVVVVVQHSNAKMNVPRRASVPKQRRSAAR